MKKFITILLLFSLPFMVIVIINLTVDNAYIFKGSRTYSKFGKLMANNENIANIYNYDEFLTRKYAIDYMTNSPEIASLGSSRVLQINNSIFENKFFFNMGVSASSLKEIVASYNILYEKCFDPEVIIIGIDPSIFLRSNSAIRESFLMDYNSMAAEIELKDSIEVIYSKSKYIELINPIYSYENIKYGKKNVFPTSSIDLEESILCSDGSYIYNSKIRNESIDKILKNAENQYVEFIHQRFDKKSMNVNLQELFESFILFLKERHEVVFFLVPYHPYIENKFEISSLEVIPKVEKYLIEFSRNNNIDLMGSYSSSKCKVPITSFDFYDAVHPKRNSVERIVRMHFNNKNYGID